MFNGPPIPSGSLPLTTAVGATRWRVDAPYVGANASKAGLLDETRRFLLAYSRLHDVAATRQELLDGGLPQRSRVTRRTITRLIQQRLVRWNPPAWVLADLVGFAAQSTSDALRAALLLHVSRQDALLYDVVQAVVVPRWRAGERRILRADVQRFLDQALGDHPEIGRWSHATREKLAGNVLSIMRDYGLLTGTAVKHIVEPRVPDAVVVHLDRLLAAEGIAADARATHPDWQLWLWEPAHVQTALDQAVAEEAVA